MWLEAWACLLCALFTFAAREDNEGVSWRDVVVSSVSTTPLRDSTRGICSPSLTITPPQDDLSWHVGDVQEVWCSVVQQGGNTNTSLSVRDLTFLKNDQRLDYQVIFV
ncbi:hypothetical protein GWK47_015132 [Chionoecetes opilio]|uniref:Uncharacterized protein n=1 Tax=Chionoecetes opilio TaxID=41210 RepID=A0A8J5CIG2_CHIOP|nr:hypothetical protein GWK47_015132 [Chionoecetes opilio]